MIPQTKYAVVIFASLSAFLLTGCGVFPAPLRLPLNIQKGHFVPQYPNEKGTLCFYWESGFYGIARGMYIDVNGIRIGGLNRGTYFAYEVNPGEFTVAAESQLDEVQVRTIKVEAGERYYFRAILGIGIHDTGGPRIEMVPNAEGEAAIIKLKYANLY
jgi:hypothetical protein